MNRPTVSTYTQPPESLGPITTLPYTPKIPASSDCETFASADLYAAAAAVAPNPNKPNTTSTAATSGASGSPAAASRTGSSSGAAPSTTNASGARKDVAHAFWGLLSVVVGVAVFA